MKISLNNISKRYLKEWIFKDITYTFESGQSYALLGNNGSGKSTLLQCIIGAVSTSKGDIYYTHNDVAIPESKVFEYITLATPYLELIEEFTTIEMLNFQRKFKPFFNIYTNENILEIVGLSAAANKQIANFSSGMKQRLKLAIAFFCNAELLALDEPTSNLDQDGITIYNKLIKDFTFNRTIIIASNDKQEYATCEKLLHLSQFK